MDLWLGSQGLEELEQLAWPEGKPQTYTIEDAKELRNLTGASLRDCLKTLRFVGGNMDLAEERLRTAGYA